MSGKYACPYCGRAFENIDRLAGHILRAHTPKTGRHSNLFDSTASDHGQAWMGALELGPTNARDSQLAI
jgi:hypothetical protein